MRRRFLVLLLCDLCLLYSYSPVHQQPQSRTSLSPTSQKRFEILPDGSVQQKPATESDSRDRRQHAASADHHSRQQQQVRVVSQQSACAGVVVGGPGQRGAKERLTSDEAATDRTSRTVRTVVYDDDQEEEAIRAATVSTRRNKSDVYTPSSPQVSSCTHRGVNFLAIVTGGGGSSWRARSSSL